VTVSYRSIVARTCSRRPTAKGAVTIPSAWKGSEAADTPCDIYLPKL